MVTLDHGREFPYGLFLGVPPIRAPKLLAECGMTEDKYVPVKPKKFETRFPDVYAVGDCARQDTRKASVFAEGTARVVATALIARLRNQEPPVTHKGTGSCYIDFGLGWIGGMEVDFFSNPDGPTGTYYEPSVALRAAKEHFGSSPAPAGSGCSDESDKPDHESGSGRPPAAVLVGSRIWLV